MQYSTKNIVTSHLSEIPRNKTKQNQWEIPMVIFFIAIFYCRQREHNAIEIIKWIKLSFSTQHKYYLNEGPQA